MKFVPIAAAPETYYRFVTYDNPMHLMDYADT